MKTKLTLAISLLAAILCVATYYFLVVFTKSHILAIPFTGMLGATLTLVIISNLLMYSRPDFNIKDVAQTENISNDGTAM